MKDESRCTVHIRHPPRSSPDDDTWLAATVAHYNGELSSQMMESFPVQRLARFHTVRAARAFSDELENTGRWEAGLSPGWVGSGFESD